MNKFKIFSLILVLFTSNLLFAQSTQNIRCGSELALEKYFLSRSVTKPNYVSLESVNNKSCYQHYVIPVVFHIFHNNGSSAVPLAQVQSALDRVNNELRGLNSDFNSVSSAFMGIRGTLDITFALATIDPSGNPTNGLNYYPAQSGFGLSNTATNTAISAIAWDNFKYFNVYIMLDLYDNGVTNESGIAWVPDLDMSNNGLARVVYNYRYLGNNGSSIADDNFQSVFTHEFGHWLNLKHTFYNGCNAPGDFVDDTPATLNITGCSPNGTSCGNLVNEENYMDYSACYMMFSQGQMDRVQNALENHPARNTLWKYDNLVATGVSSFYTNVIPEAEFSASEITIYKGQTIFFTDQSCGFPNQWQWTINGADQINVSTQNAFGTFNTVGTYKVKLVASNVIGNSNPYSLIVTVEEPPYNCQILYDFENEGIGMSASGWTENVGNGDGWIVEQSVLHPYNDVGNFTSRANKSFKSLINTDNWVGSGPIEMRLISPPLDLTGISKPHLNYYDLRAWDSNWPTNKPEHITEIFVSLSSNGPWTLLHSDTATTSEFYTWRHIESIDLEAYTDDVIYISFRTNTHHYYWRLDDVCISDNTIINSVKTPSKLNGITVYPNPVNDVIHINSVANNELYVLIDIYGKEILRTSNSELNIAELAAGVYVLQVFSNDGFLLQRVKIIKE